MTPDKSKAEIDLKEQLAAIEHERWADWQRWVHTNMKPGNMISPELVKQWERQIATPYAELSEREKQSDRDQVDRYWPLIQSLITAAEQRGKAEGAREELEALRDKSVRGHIMDDIQLESAIDDRLCQLEQPQEDTE